MKQRESRIVLLVILLALLQSGFLVKKSARLRDFQVAYLPEGGVSVSFHLFRAFRADIEEKIASGAEVSFDYLIRLYKTAAYWPDRMVDQQRIRTTVRYDGLTQEYHFTRRVDGQVEEEAVTNRAAEMRHWMTTIRTQAFRSFRPKPGYHYDIRIKAVIEYDFVLYFLPEDFDTDWRRKPLPEVPGE